MRARGAVVLLVLAVSGCGAPYLLRAAYEEVRILWRREPIGRVLERGDLATGTREKLQLVLAVRDYARDVLAFDVGESYASLARVDDDVVVWAVTAAHRDRLASYTWWYPIVGRVPYRGFFDRRRADACAAGLDAGGLDTAVWPTSAFSTLGWFADPLLSNMLEDDSVELTTVIFHELTHAQVYVPSAADFNESFANFVGHRAAVAFFCEEGAGDRGSAASRCALAEDRWHDERVYADVLAELERELEALYASAPAPEIRAVRRRAILAAASTALAGRPLKTNRYRSPDLAAFNNAIILQQLLYRRHLAWFEALWAAKGERLTATVQTVIETVGGAGDPFGALAGAMGFRNPGR